MRNEFLELARRIARPFMGKGYGRLPVIRSLVEWYRKLYRPESVEVEGRKIYLNPADDKLSPYLAMNGYFEKMETALIRQHVKPGMRVLDVGANIGYFTVLCSALVGERGCVVAIEPDDTNFSFLERSVAELPEKNTRVVKAAAWQESGKLDLYISTENPGDHQSFPGDTTRNHYTVDSVAIDDLVEAESGFDLVKMDIQGSEGHALQGMQKTFRQNPPGTLILEFWPSGLAQAGTPPEDVYAVLKGMGYRIQHISNEDEKLYTIHSYQDIVDFCDIEWKFMNLLCLR